MSGLPNPLNPGAGAVPVPEDPREIDAALRAGRISVRIFPYLDWRYGERGARFTRSDSAWLAWLSRHSQQHVNDQIAWLRSVLSNRGMPSSILETHLIILYRQLTRSVSELESQYRTLFISADELHQDRHAKIPPEASRQLVSGFVAALPQGPTFLLFGVARLLVAAVADEMLGVKYAVPRLTAWLVDVPRLRELPQLRARLSPRQLRVLDSQSFAERWRKAIETTVTKARRT